MKENKDFKIVRKKKKINIKDYFKSNDKKINIEYKDKEKMPISASIVAAIKIFILTLISLGICGVIVGLLILKSWTSDIPELDTTILQASSQSSYIYANDETLIATFSSTENREWVELENIPQDLIDAFISVEDVRFYDHGAIDIKRFANAVLGQFIGGTAGGSTITQQLIKNAYLTNETTYKRKTQEIILAYQLEKKMTKDEILESYLNIIYFGESNYGVAAAARDYFGKSLDELTLKECACLAGIVKNPNGYDPRKNMYVREDMQPTEDRTETVLYTMYTNGYITKEEYQSALDEEFIIKESSTAATVYPYAHFVEYIISDVIDDMIEAEGLEDTTRNRQVLEYRIRRGGYKIYSTLDIQAQETLQSTTSTYDSYPDVLDDNGEVMYDEENNKVLPQTAAVIISQENGHIVAMIGSRDEVTAYKTFNRATSNNFPIASTIKPISIYAPAFEKGYSPATIEYDYKTPIEGYGLTASYPSETHYTEAPMTLRKAIDVSSNIVAARTLCNKVGYETSVSYLSQLGIDYNDIEQNGSGLALGTSGISILQLTAAYATIANSGTYYEPKSYTVVKNAKDEEILNSETYQIKREVFSKATCWMMVSCLKEAATSYNATIEGITTAGKTGTHESKCAVFAGFSPYYTSAIWVGSDAYKDLSDASGNRQAAPIFSKYMTKIHKDKELEDKQILNYSASEANVSKYEVCTVSGKLATDKCREEGCTTIDYFNNNYKPTEECDMHVDVEYCWSSGDLSGIDCPSWARHTQTALFIPSDSYFNTIPQDLILKTYPNAIFEKNLKHCTYHNAGNGTYVSEDEITAANTLIESWNNLINTGMLSMNDISLAMDYVKTLTELVSQYNTTTSEEEANIYTNNFRTTYLNINTVYTTIMEALSNGTYGQPQETSTEENQPEETPPENIYDDEEDIINDDVVNEDTLPVIEGE